MRYRSNTIVALSFCIQGAVWAQSLTAFNVPVPGDLYHYSDCGGVDPGTTGTGITWDFSGLTCDQPVLIMVFPPANTDGLNGDFPSATAAVGVPGTYWTYFRAVANAYQTLGARGTDSTFRTYSDPMDNFHFPFSYGDSFEDTFYGDGDGADGPYTFSGTINGSANGTGTVIVPYGTLNNILRCTYVSVHEEVLPDPFTTITTTVTQHAYTRTGTKHPVVAVNETEVVVSGTTLFFIISAELMSEEDVVGMLEPAGRRGFALAPVPSTGTVWLMLDRVSSEPLTASIVDGTGRVVLADELPAGSDRHELSLHALPAGSYIVRVISQDGAMSTARLLKE